MRYYELKMTFPQLVEEDDMGIYISDLSDLGFESFTSEDDELKGYINEKEYKTFSTDIDSYIKDIEELLIKCELTLTKDENWNELWESNFEPIYVDTRCCIRAPFHKKSDCEYEIIIMPKMSFGTGHHATTYLMVEKILEMDIKGRNGLDMGSGTGVLAILAIKRGADFMDAIDIDEWAAENCKENAETNEVSDKMLISCDDVKGLRARNYDFIFANINRNILLQDMAEYVNHLNEGGDIIFSGFLSPDVKDITEKANSLGLSTIEIKERDGWQRVHVKRTK